MSNSQAPRAAADNCPPIDPLWRDGAQIVFQSGDCLDLLRSMPDNCAQLVVTSPPYNIGKAYESRLGLEEYLREQQQVIQECARILADSGSICWQVGNHIPGPQQIIPLDMLLYPIFSDLHLQLRNRVIWYFEHGLHSRKRLSGRYETILWFTKGDDYHFDLDAVRVPQKYPGKKYYKGPKIGEYSANPLGKNPGDVWDIPGDVWDIPNVKHNHIEKTSHPCQFPVELIERLVLCLSEPGQLVVDPYMGVASTAVAALLHDRRVAGAEAEKDYVTVGLERIRQTLEGTIRTRPMSRPKYEPVPSQSVATRPSTNRLPA